MTISRSDAVQQIERALLGSLLLSNHLWPEAASVDVDDLSLDSHRRMFSTMSEMFRSQRPVDLTTLTDELSQRRQLDSCGGHAYVARLIDDAVPENIVDYIRRIRGEASRRKIARNAERVSALAAEASPENALALRDETNSLLDLLNVGEESSIRTSANIPDIFSLQVPEMDYLIADILPRGNVMLLTGNPGCGKSFLALKMAVSVAMGGKFLGRTCEPASVVIIDKENPIQLQRQRLVIVGGGPIPNLRIWGGWLPDPPPMLGDPRLATFARDEKPLMIFDSLVRFHDADENEASEMRNIMAHARRLADAGATVVLLHHKPKSDESLYRGSSDILAAVDMAFILEVEEVSRLRLRCFKSRWSEERTFAIQADFAAGHFALAESSALLDAGNEAERVQAVIESKPGCTTNYIKREAGLRGETLGKLLRDHLGKRWRTESGLRKSKLYYPLGLVPRLVPEKAAGTSAGN
jgi:archaellum biogenesis ATPase FlaH